MRKIWRWHWSLRKVGLSLEDVLEEFENLRICFGEGDMEMALEFKESGTLLGRHLGEV